MAEEKREFSAMILLAMLAVLFWFYDAVSYFQLYTLMGPLADPLWIVFGIIELLFALYIFLALALWKLIPIKLPLWWWLLLVFGVITLVFGYLGLTASYWTGMLAIMAALIEFFGGSKGWKANKIMALLGAAFGIYECILLFYALTLAFSTDFLMAGLFGLILCIILIILIFDFVDIKIPYEWWVLLIIGFMFFQWISIYAAAVAIIAAVPLAGWAGMILFIAFILHLLDF